MREGLPHSLALHTVVILLVVFGLPKFWDDEVMTMSAIPVEIVNASDISSAPQQRHTQSQPQPTPPQPPPPQPEPQPTPPPEPPPPPEPDDVPAPPEQDQTPSPPQPTPPPEPPKPPRPPRARPTPPRPQQQAQPPRQQQRPANNQFSNLLNNLSETPDEQPTQEGVDNSPVQQSPSLSDVLNSSEMDAVRQQVMGCWLEPTGLREGAEMIVEIKVEVNQDRTVRSAKVVDSPRMRTDPFYRNLSETAVRAFYNPRCSPLQLPEGKYSTWRSITFRFSPQGIN